MDSVTHTLGTPIPKREKQEEACRFTGHGTFALLKPTLDTWSTRAPRGPLAARNVPSCADSPQGTLTPSLHSPTLPSSSSILGHACLEERAAGCQDPAARAGPQGTHSPPGK